jgi:hypothetical protein
MMPLQRWLGRELKGDLQYALGPAGLQRRGLIRSDAIQRLLHEHSLNVHNHAMRLWVLLILERWFARYEPSFSL